MVKTNYMNVLETLIRDLNFLKAEDMGDPDVRHKCASAMYKAHCQISDPSKKELSYTIMNYGGDLESETVLEIDNPMYDQDLKDFEKLLDKITAYLEQTTGY